MQRRPKTALLVGAVVVLAGCTAIPGSESSGGATPTASVQTETTTTVPTTTVGGATSAVPTLTRAPREPYPDPPSNLTAGAVTRAAKAYDEARIHNALREEYRDFSVGFWKPTSADVINRTERGVHVRVVTTYSYQYDSGYVDGLESRAIYLVNTTTVRRVSGGDLRLR